MADKKSSTYEQLVYNIKRIEEIDNLPKDEKEPHRSTNWAFEIYEESAPSDWENKLASLLIDTFYIKHDMDVNADGTLKKPHWHIQLLFGKTKKSPRQVYDLAKFVGGDGLGGDAIIRLASATGYARYLTHIDYADKHHYSVDDVKVLGGTDYLEKYGKTYNVKLVIREMSEYVRENRLRYYVDLCDYAEQFRSDDWYDALTRKGGCSYYMREYIKSYQFKINELANQKKTEEENYLNEVCNNQLGVISELKKKLSKLQEIVDRYEDEKNKK